MSTIRVTRLIAADPTGTALLLAGRTALDLWPGATRLAHAPVRDVVVEPPRRLPTAYVTTFRFTGEGLPDAGGTVTLTRSWAGEHPATDADLALTWEGGDPGVAAALRAMADAFLAGLAAAAEERAFAA